MSDLNKREYRLVCVLAVVLCAVIIAGLIYFNLGCVP